MRKWSSAVVLGLAIFVAVALPGATLSASTPEHGYVTSSLAIPMNGTQAKAYGRDITGDGHVDNALGSFFAALASSGLDSQSDTDAAIQGGQLLMLHSLRSLSLRTAKKATWQVLYAKPTNTPNFSGAGVFKVDGSGPRSVRLPAKIRRHHVKTAAGIIPVKLDLGGILTLRLTKGVIFATCSQSTCSHGRITGVVTPHNIDTQLIPHLAAQFTALVARDCPGPGPASCVDGSSGKTIESLFDSNADLVISSAELSQNNFMQVLLAPDIDLNHDGVLDGLSVGFGFGTVRAKLVR